MRAKVKGTEERDETKSTFVNDGKQCDTSNGRIVEEVVLTDEECRRPRKIKKRHSNRRACHGRCVIYISFMNCLLTYRQSSKV